MRQKDKKFEVVKDSETGEEVYPEPPKRKAGKKKRFLEWLAEFGHVSIACKAAGVCRATIYRWKKDDEKFDNKWEEVLIEFGSSRCEKVDDACFREALNGNTRAMELYYGRKRNWIRPKIVVELQSEEMTLREARKKIREHMKSHPEEEKRLFDELKDENG